MRDDISKPVSSVPEVQDLDPLGVALLHMDKQPRQTKWSAHLLSVSEHYLLTSGFMCVNPILEERNHLKKFKIRLQRETYTLLSKQRTNNKREPLRDTDGKVVHKFVELACNNK